MNISINRLPISNQRTGRLFSEQVTFPTNDGVYGRANSFISPTPIFCLMGGVRDVMNRRPRYKDLIMANANSRRSGSNSLDALIANIGLDDSIYAMMSYIVDDTTGYPVTSGYSSVSDQYFQRAASKVIQKVYDFGFLFSLPYVASEYMRLMTDQAAKVKIALHLKSAPILSRNIIAADSVSGQKSVEDDKPLPLQCLTDSSLLKTIRDKFSTTVADTRLGSGGYSHRVVIVSGDRSNWEELRTYDGMSELIAEMSFISDLTNFRQL